MLRWNIGKTNSLVLKAPAADGVLNRKERASSILMVLTNPYLVAALR